jgi:hypothetical protein
MLPKSFTNAHTLAGSALMVIDLSTLSGDGPCADADIETKLVVKLSAINARIFFIHFSPKISVMRGTVQKQQYIIK